MNRTKKVLYNTLTAALNMVVHQIISLIVSIKVLEVYGADYHGLNSILSNVMIWVLLLESGLTTASTVALYKPYMSKDYDRCNEILAASKKQFHKIGGLIFLVGLGVAIFYPLFLTTDIPYWDICLMFAIMSLSTSFGVFFTRRFAVLYSVTQNEFINQLIAILYSILGNALIYVLAVQHAHYLWVRTVYLGITVATGITVALLIKKKYPFINYNVKPDFSAIKGTKDVVVQKLTSVIRTSAPALFISVFDSTVAASVYAVNMYGYNFVRTIMSNVLTATQSGIGQVVAEKNQEGIYKVFRSFEYAMTTILLWLMSSAIAVTIPFINFYTRNVEGIEYISYFLWLIIPLNYSIQVLHLPSGVIINMHARFKEDKNFQIISIVVMLITMGIAGYLYGLNGIMVGVTAGSLTLGVQELSFARKKIMHQGFGDFFRPLLLDLCVLLPLLAVEFFLIPQKLTLAWFFLTGLTVVLVHGAALFAVNWMFERERLQELIHRFSKIFRKK